MHTRFFYKITQFIAECKIILYFFMVDKIMNDGLFFVTNIMICLRFGNDILEQIAIKLVSCKVICPEPE